MTRSKIIVNIAICAAMLSAVKYALSMVANVELVTLMIIVFASKLRLSHTLTITSTFCMIEALFFGLNTWVISYIIHWNLLGLVMFFVTRIPLNSTILIVGLITFVALVLTTLFGVISTLVDTGLFTGFLDDFWTRFGIMYLRGGYFFLAQIVSNAIIVPLLYLPVRKVYSRAIGNLGDNNSPNIGL